MSRLYLIRGLTILAAAIIPFNAALADPSTPANPAATIETNAGAPANAANDQTALTSAGAADTSYMLKAGDPNVVTNGPIPDTPENRAKYGLPDSQTGRNSAPAGN